MRTIGHFIVIVAICTSGCGDSSQSNESGNELSSNLETKETSDDGSKSGEHKSDESSFDDEVLNTNSIDRDDGNERLTLLIADPIEGIVAGEQFTTTAGYTCVDTRQGESGINIILWPHSIGESYVEKNGCQGTGSFWDGKDKRSLQIHFDSKKPIGPYNSGTLYFGTDGSQVSPSPVKLDAMKVISNGNGILVVDFTLAGEGTNLKGSLSLAVAEYNPG